MEIQGMYERERKSVISVNIKAYIPNRYINFYGSKKKANVLALNKRQCIYSSCFLCKVAF